MRCHGGESKIQYNSRLGYSILIQREASLKEIPCGKLVERAAGSDDYELRLSWLTHHGASYREVQGGINRLSVANIMTEGISEKPNSFSQMGIFGYIGRDGIRSPWS